MCAGIAAYKAVEVCRSLVDLGCQVTVAMTADAQNFVGPMTFSALSGRPVLTSIFDPNEPLAHTRLAGELDLIVVAPATADFIAKYRAGIADNGLLATLAASSAPVVIAPAMHSQMWENPATQENVAVLQSRGVLKVGPDTGLLAGGDVGIGRLADPVRIVDVCVDILSGTDRGVEGNSLSLEGIKVLVTSGGTREPIDPVRFIGNRSSGKQGTEIALQVCLMGGTATLITTLVPQIQGLFSTSIGDRLTVVEVETAQEMAEAVFGEIDQADIVIMTAAVADFRPARVLDHKYKKSSGPPNILLEPTVDILDRIGHDHRDDQVIVGFCAETENLENQARLKLVSKQADLIVANDVSKPQVGFGYDTNEVLLVTQDGHYQVPLTTKEEIARAVLSKAAEIYRNKTIKER